jgi:hypothetical protein
VDYNQKSNRPISSPQLFVITRQNSVITNVGFFIKSRFWQFFIRH